MIPVNQTIIRNPPHVSSATLTLDLAVSQVLIGMEDVDEGGLLALLAVGAGG